MRPWSDITLRRTCLRGNRNPAPPHLPPPFTNLVTLMATRWLPVIPINPSLMCPLLPNPGLLTLLFLLQTIRRNLRKVLLLPMGLLLLWWRGILVLLGLLLLLHRQCIASHTLWCCGNHLACERQTYHFWWYPLGAAGCGGCCCCNCWHKAYCPPFLSHRYCSGSCHSLPCLC